MEEVVSAWRLVRTERGSLFEAFSGEGARLFGGRWNSVGVPVVYTSSALSLAALETLVHADRSDFARDWIAFQVSIPKALALELREEDLPADWRAVPVSEGARHVGDTWVRASASAALSVPSAIVPVERNWLLNPAHPAFGQVAIGEPQRFRFDDRLAAPEGIG